MTTAERLADHLSARPQVRPEEMDDIRAAGFRSIICNRPDGEEAGQPPFAEVEAAAAKAGLQARCIPVTPDGIADADVQAFGRALEELPHPILAYCRSGKRSAALWSRQGAGGRAGG